MNAGVFGEMKGSNAFLFVASSLKYRLLGGTFFETAGVC